ncbi:MAG: hypothetical protein A3E36_01175 [Candidatus Andersenbacteria bacterium RIFCSPHIGHO2_12_FULL_45_11b]|uniref:Uncharacterized protein n=1 Tax=Candidatus Andersenbacteria bacterium RIFCSPHIGHO2_12_FULL_45_11b TaxID=1797282 RepID=A0A1G1XB60_9BACT|nr:MAG: hypothetical protein A3E36_01175 [Candidatus Andersenbacteria bacterium RIFCSPHIGHO2_12_FULL_45_11b]
MEIDEQKLKEILKGEREEYQRATQVYIEHSDSNVKAVAEQYLGLSKKVDGLAHDMRAGFEKINQELDDVKRTGEATFEQVGTLVMKDTEEQEVLKNHEQRITKLEQKN